MNFQCPHCSYAPASIQGWKSHMSRSHGGWNLKQLEESGGEPTARDRARALSGYQSLAEVKAAAPELEGTPAPTSAIASRKPRITREEAEKAERVRLARERIGGVICDKAARSPYRLWAALAGDPSLKLSDEEALEMKQAYEQLAEGLGADFTLWYFALLAVLAVNADCIAARIGPTPTEGLRSAGGPKAEKKGDDKA